MTEKHPREVDTDFSQASDENGAGRPRSNWGLHRRRQARCTAWISSLTTLVAIMAVGGVLGVTGIGIPFAEIGIALSVLVLGAIVALNLKAPVAVAMGVVGLFAIFHGHAHGVEIPENVGGVAYAAGFLMATATLHLAGISAGFLIGKAGEYYGSVVVRLVGGLSTAAGVALLVGIL